jgi:hypothetical protein
LSFEFWKACILASSYSEQKFEEYKFTAIRACSQRKKTQYIERMSRRVSVAVLAVTAVIAALAVLAASPALATGGKLALQHSSVSLAVTQSAGNFVQPDEPIICPQVAQVCDITLDFSASIPAGMSMTSAGILHWTSTEWFQIRGFTLSLSDDSGFTDGQVVTLAATAVSASEYYSNFIVTLPVTISIPGSRTPSGNTPAATSAVALPSTGLSLAPLAISALLVLGLGTSMLVAARRRRHS